jgi:hypothetical protein
MDKKKGLPKEVYELEWFLVWGAGRFCYYNLQKDNSGEVKPANFVSAFLDYLQDIKFNLKWIPKIFEVLDEYDKKNVYPRDSALIAPYALTRIALKRYLFLAKSEK